MIPLVVSVFGYNMVHTFSRYAWIVSFLVLIVFTTIASLHFDVSWPDQGSGLSQDGNVLSFMGVIFGSACGYTPIASDYYCKYPVSQTSCRISKLKISDRSSPTRPGGNLHSLLGQALLLQEYSSIPLELPSASQSCPILRLAQSTTVAASVQR